MALVGVGRGGSAVVGTAGGVGGCFTFLLAFFTVIDVAE